jgi:hypothetical protein
MMSELTEIDMSRTEDHEDEPSRTTVLTQYEQARRQRVDDYQVDALKMKDALAANLGLMSGGLMRTSLWIEEAISDAMSTQIPTVEGLQQLLPAIETQLKLTRQVDRLAQVSIRISDER